jgi:NAD(P)-dependent dehydrogenase (short-subunit alcohol dehydrogenase family)
MARWNSDSIPNQKGKIAVITGGNIGLGYQISHDLANKGAHIIIACRTKSKGQKAIENIEKSLNRKISAEVITLDLTSKKSISNFAIEFGKKYRKLDLLINNAGVINLISREETNGGLEMHMATNHYGHFALTALLIPYISKAKSARVVTMSSGAYRSGDIDFNDINWNNRTYSRSKSYGDSKLANMLFMMELERFFIKNSIDAISLSAHPGLSATERQQTIGIGGRLTKFLAQPVTIGALPALMAATHPDAKGGEYYGPRWFIRGYPKLEKKKPIVFNKDLAKKLWALSEQITGVRF